MKSRFRLSFTVPGVPVPKGRPRMTRAGIAFTPKSTRSYESRLALAAGEAMQSAGFSAPVLGPLAVYVGVCLPVPSSWPQWRVQAALRRNVVPTGLPDVDNVLKTIDALNGIVWKDDSQIVRALVEKVYDARPRLEVSVRALPALSPKARKKDLTS